MRRGLAYATRGGDDEFSVAVAQLVPGRKYDRYFGYAPWYFWEVGTGDGRRAFVLFEVFGPVAHPGSTPVRISVFDDAGRLVSEATFDTGHRRYLCEVALRPTGANEKPILVFKVARLFANAPTQYYTWIGDRVDLIRLEKEEGTPVRNDYYVKHFRCGPELPRQTADQWQADLESTDRARVLRALVWLAGVHWDPRNGKKWDSQYESSQDAELVRAVLRRYWVQARLKEFSEGADAWLREAACLVLHPDPEDPPRVLADPM